MRRFILFAFFLAFFVYGCVGTEYKYVCPNGAIVTNKMFCENKEPIQKEEDSFFLTRMFHHFLSWVKGN